MVTVNNFSREVCKVIANERNWKKDVRRNVVEVDGEKWSFSLFSKEHPECRQYYEDSVGFIAYHQPSGKLLKYRVKDYATFNVSRITAMGLKAYNVFTSKTQCEEFGIY